MSWRHWLTTAGGVVTFLMTMAGGFLLGFAPPPSPIEASSNFAVGLGTLITTFAFLIVVAVVRLAGKKVKPPIWLGVAAALLIVFVPTAFSYRDYKQEHTFVWDDGAERIAFIAGEELTPEAARLAQKLEEQEEVPTPETLVSYSGGPHLAEAVWTRESLLRASRTMDLYYFLALVTICLGAFFLLEGVLPMLPKKKKRR